MRPLYILLVLPLIAALATAEEPSLVRLNNGESTSMKLSNIGDEKFYFTRENKERTIPLIELFKWGQPVDMKPGPYLLLNDASLLFGAVSNITGEQVLFASTKRPGMWRENRVPREEVRAIVLQSSWLASERETLEDKWLASIEKTDRLLFTDGDSLAGTLLSADRVKNENDDSLVLRFQPTGATVVEIPQARVRAILLRVNASAPIPSQNGFWLGLKDGSCFFVQACERVKDEVHLKRNNQYSLIAQAHDADLEPPPTFFDRVVYLQPLTKNVVYLSDQTAIGFKHVPLLGWEGNYRQNRSVTGAGLRIGSTRYLKGIGMPATSRLAFEIPPGAKRFESEVGIDAAAETRGSCVFRVFLETSAGNWQVAKESPVMRGGDAPQTLSVELGTAKRIALVVEMSTRGDVCDWADWLDARIVIGH